MYIQILDKIFFNYDPVGTRGHFPGGEVARTWSWPLTSI